MQNPIASNRKGSKMDLKRSDPMSNTRYVKPQEHWGWPIALDLYLAGTGAGSFIIGVLMDWLGYSAYPSNALFLWGAVLVAIAAPFLILDLGIKQRFLNACLNPGSSWLSRGFLIISAFILVGMAVLVMSILPISGIEVGKVPFRIVEGAGLVLALATAIYTGMLLKSVKYVPLWNTGLLPLLFLTSALCTGSMIVIMSALGSDLVSGHHLGYSAAETLINVQRGILMVEAVLLGLFLFFAYRNSRQGERSVRLLLQGKLKVIFWAGIVVSIFCLPLILESLYSSAHPYFPFAAGLFLLGGDICLRLSIVSAGIKERPPLSNLMVVPDSSLLPGKAVDDSIFKEEVS
jgi:polysulfide reductase chain C